MSVAASNKRIEMMVDARHVHLIRACLANHAACTDVTVTPMLSGWSLKGCGPSRTATPFLEIGSKASIRFTADETLLAPLLKNGFGILAMDLIPITEAGVAA